MKATSISFESLPEIPGYVVTKMVHKGPRHTIFSGHKEGSNNAVFLKTPSSKYPSDRELATLQRAYEVARPLPESAVIRHLELIPAIQKLVMVTAGEGGMSLDQWLREIGQPDLVSALEICKSMFQALGELHAANIIHKDIRPPNILWDAEDKQVRFIDFAASSLLENDAADNGRQELWIANLAYMAPEQTGRTNRPVDFRADLYSAGITMYELLAGKLPFPPTDVRGMIHAQLAISPPALDPGGKRIPGVVSEIVMKLLQKNPEDRYISAAGVASDISACLEGLEKGSIGEVRVSTEVVHSRLILPNQLYGREQETGRLFETLGRVLEGTRSTLLVSGYSGVGKSSLIDELQVHVIGREGLFCRGKFDQFRRDVPFLGWRGVLQSMIRQLLTLPEHKLQAIVSMLAKETSGNLSLIAELVPELKLLVGNLENPPHAGPQEAQARFINTFRTFINVIAKSGNVLLLFIDDLQWADLASIKLLEALATDREQAGVFIIGAYRDNEVDSVHILTSAMKVIRESPAGLQEIQLQALEEKAVHQLVADVVKPPALDISGLSSLIYRKTGGNPFFIRQFLTSLYRKRLLYFDLVTSQWFWEAQALETESFTDNVLAFMSGKLGELPACTLEALEVASCIGVEFDLQILAKIAGCQVSEMAEWLEPALVAGYIVPLDDEYRFAREEALFAESRGHAVEINPYYRFLHDRVQQTAHDRIENRNRSQLHLRIAREIYAAAVDRDAPELALNLMEHLHHSANLMEDPTERLEFAEISLLAASRAKASMAMLQAGEYLAVGRSLLPVDCWETCPRLTLDVYLNSADVAYISEDFTTAESFCEEALAHASDFRDRTIIHNIRIGIGVARSRYVEAVKYGLEVLDKELGVKISSSLLSLRLLGEYLKILWKISRLSNGQILNMPDMQDEKKISAMAMMMKCSTNAYWANQMLLPVIAGKMLNFSFRHGKTGLTAYGFALMGMISAQALNDVDIGYRMGKLSLMLLEKTGEQHLLGKTGLLWHGFIRHCKEPLRLCAANTLDCYQYAMDSGDVENAVYCVLVAYYGELMAGRPLPWIRARYRDYLPAMLETDQSHTIETLQVWRQVAANLEDRNQAQSRATGDIVNWPERLARLLTEEGSGLAIASVAGGAGWLAFLLDDMNHAEYQFSLLYERKQNALGLSFWKPCMALYAVVLARKVRAGNATIKDRWRLSRLGNALDKWAQDNTHDFTCFRKFLAAELHQNKARMEQALIAWSEAMENAHDSGFLYMEALAAEQAAAVHAMTGSTQQARFFNERALNAWKKQGVMSRLHQKMGISYTVGADSQDDKDGKYGSLNISSINIDTVLASVRTLSESIDVDELAARILELGVLNSGARRGLLLVKDKKLVPLFSARVDHAGKMTTAKADYPVSSANMPVSLVDYISRTREKVLVEDAQTHEWLSRDEYIIRNRSRSVLAMPLLRQGELVGMVILENELGVGVFSDADLAIVQAIAGQAAVSLENAKLFAAQKRQTAAFALFVPRQFLEHLGHEEVEDIRLGEAVERRVTVMFADLRGFTTLSEGMEINDNFALLNAFHARMNPVILENGGFIDEFTGDGFKALFIDNAAGGARAAIGMQERLGRYNKERSEKNRQILTMGVGVHTGQALLGTIGAQDRRSTTVIGDTVNTAARLEGLTKAFGTPSVISGTTYDDLPDKSSIAVRPVGRVRVKGRKQPISVYELIGARQEQERKALEFIIDDFKAAFDAYQQQEFAKAKTLFTACLDRVPDDRLSQYYLKSTADLLEKGVPENWENIIVLTEK